MENKVIILYMPVVHAGYLNFIESCLSRGRGIVYILGDGILEHLPKAKTYKERDLRAISTALVKIAVQKYGYDAQIIESPVMINYIFSENECVYMPDEDISHELLDIFSLNGKVVFQDVFLRMDRKFTLKTMEVEADVTFTEDERARLYMEKTKQLAQKSNDWWRQIGSVIVTVDGTEIFGFNHHPDDRGLYENGDPRSNFDAGENIELSTAIHSETTAIANAARQGIALEGATLYVTVFPCPVCAKIVAESGIKEIYFEQGYSRLDGENILKKNGIKLYRVIPSLNN